MKNLTCLILLLLFGGLLIIGSSGLVARQSTTNAV